jgi:AraC-like DNA-binding protein
VDRYWIPSWDLEEPYVQEVLAHPVANVVFEHHEITLLGVSRARGRKELVGSGRAVGVMFRPAGFRPFLGAPMATTTDRVLPAGDVLDVAPIDGPAVLRAVDEESVALIERWLLPSVPAERAPSEDTTELVELVAADRSIGRVDELAAVAGTSVRQLQRRFADHVGASPKWVIRRYRLYEAAEATAHGDDVDWAELAGRLGYSDQSHLIREFTAAVGVSPARYAMQNRVAASG